MDQDAHKSWQARVDSRAPVAFTTPENLEALETEHVKQMWSERLLSEGHIGLYLSAPPQCPLITLIQTMFESTDGVRVERVTITREQYLAACADAPSTE